MKLKKMAIVMMAALAVMSAPVVGRAEKTTESKVEALVYAEDSGSFCFLVGSLVENDDLFLLLGYGNGGTSNNYPALAFNVKAFQDGVSLQSSFSLSKPINFEDNSTVTIQPGASVRYHECFKLRNQSPVEVQISPLIDFTGNKTVSYTIPFEDLNKGVNMVPADQAATETSAAAAPVADTAPVSGSEDWQTKYYDLLEKYNALQEKYNALLESVAQ